MDQHRKDLCTSTARFRPRDAEVFEVILLSGNIFSFDSFPDENSQQVWIIHIGVLSFIIGLGLVDSL